MDRSPSGSSFYSPEWVEGVFSKARPYGSHKRCVWQITCGAPRACLASERMGRCSYRVYESPTREASMEGRSDRFTAVEDQYAGYTVYDPDGDKIGKVDDLFVDENDQPEYIGVKIGLLGSSSSRAGHRYNDVQGDSEVPLSRCSPHARAARLSHAVE